MAAELRQRRVQPMLFFPENGGNYQLAVKSAIAFGSGMATPSTAGAAEVRAECERVRVAGGRVGFVPTMGALHDGHLALVREARRRAEFVVVSIFVNPRQFGPAEDFVRYPRDIEADLRILEGARADLAFTPATADMYPDGEDTRVRVLALAESLEGAHRPGHLEGVTTVVAKLLGIVGRCVSIFGRKDYQQLLVVRRMVQDLFLPVEVVGHPIVREPDGLAMSSRNAYLSAGERRRALSIARGLDTASQEFARGERRARELERAARAPIEAVASSIDYVEARDADWLSPIDEVGGRAVLAVACRIGSTRLIDNVVLGEDASPLVGSS